MCLGLLLCKVRRCTAHLLGRSLNRRLQESPRWLAQKGRNAEALKNLAYLRKGDVHDEHIRAEMAEIEATVIEEQESRAGLGWKEAFLGKGNWPR